CGTTPDARAASRPAGAGCDAGAYELAPPVVTTGAASSITASSATVTGSVNVNARAATVHAEFGPTTAYGSTTADQPLAVSATPPGPPAPGAPPAPAPTFPLTGLAPGTVIHYRLVATNADGTTAGADATFTTLTVPPPVSRFAGVGLGKGSLTASRSRVVNVS